MRPFKLLALLLIITMLAAACTSAATADVFASAKRFVDYVLSPEGQAILTKWRFIPAKP